MNYAYLRVSGSRQDVENQKFNLLKFANSRDIKIDEFVDETISTRKSLSSRKLGALIGELGSGDTLLISEITRLGRSLFEVMGILNDLMEKGVRVFSVKEGYELGNNLNSKILAFAFGVAGEIERELISMRTKDALARKRAEGMVLGRPVGALSKITKLSGKEGDIQALLEKRVSVASIARIMSVSRGTMTNFIKTRLAKNF